MIERRRRRAREDRKGRRGWVNGGIILGEGPEIGDSRGGTPSSTSKVEEGENEGQPYFYPRRVTKARKYPNGS